MKVVVVGNGMVGSRLVTELCASAQPDGAALDITVLGAEDHTPYNRVLLSEVVAGAYDVASIDLPTVTDPRVSVWAGVAAVTVDRHARVVVDSTGGRHRYDVLVLATGATARVPALAGLLRKPAPGVGSSRGGEPTSGAEPMLGVAPQPGEAVQPGTGPWARAAQQRGWEPLSAAGGARGAEALVPGAHVLRTIDDAREILAASANARRVVVLGAGVLGIEAAVGLAERVRPQRAPVQLVHPRGLMNAQLAPAAGAAAADVVARLGVDVRTGVGAAAVTLRGGRLAGLVLTDGETLPADLLVLTTGTEPETQLARESGLDVDRGVVVGPDLATLRDPRIFAVGDCAQPPEGGAGLVAQGWDQARRLARTLAEGAWAFSGEPQAVPSVGPGRDGVVDARPQDPEGSAAGQRAAEASGSTAASGCAPGVACTCRPTDDSSVVKVKGRGVDIVAMGVCGSARPPACPQHPSRTVRLDDPDAGRYVEVVVQDDRVVGATCVGAGAVGADLVAAFTRGTPAPRDPAQLLLRAVGPAVRGAETPVRIPDRATICRCNGVTKGDLVRAWHDGCRSVADVARTTRATTGCGGCREPVCGILDWLRAAEPTLAAAPAAAAAQSLAPARESVGPGTSPSVATDGLALERTDSPVPAG